MMFSSTKWLLKATGSSRVRLSDNLHLPYKIYEFFVRAIYLWSVVVINVNCVQSIGVQNDQAMSTLPTAIHFICCTIKLLLLMRRKTVQLIETAFDDHFEDAGGGQTITRMLKNYKRYVLILNLIGLAYTYALVVLFNIRGDSPELQKSPSNVTENPVYIITMWMPFDVPENFDLALTVQRFLYSVVSAGSCSTASLFNGVMIYAVVKLKVMKYKFLNFDNYLTEPEEGLVNVKMAPEKALRNLKQLIREHQNLIRFIRDLNDNIEYGIFIEYSVNSLMLGCLLLQLVKGYRTGVFTLYFMVLTFQLFVFSYNAEEISYQSSQIGTAIYESDWYLHGADVQWLVYTIMVRAQRELYLTIGPFGPNSLGAATARMKLAYSYTSVMSGNRL